MNGLAEARASRKQESERVRERENVCNIPQGGLLLLPLVSSVDSRLQARPWATPTSTTTGAVSQRTGGVVGALAEAAQRSCGRTCSDLPDRARVLPFVLALRKPELTPRLGPDSSQVEDGYRYQGWWPQGDAEARTPGPGHREPVHPASGEAVPFPGPPHGCQVQPACA